MEPIDLLLVTFDHVGDVKAVIERIYRFTANPFRLLIANNGGDPVLTDYLHGLAVEKGNVMVVENPRNLYCCRATNQLLRLVQSRYAFYLCSHEAFILKHGWDQHCIESMETHPKAGLGGHLSWSKYYETGADYSRHEFFSRLRNPSFALEQKDRKFFHVQGGFLAIRMDMAYRIGGFNEQLEHNYMDVEYSYYAESCGWELLSIPRVLSIHRTTQPNLENYNLADYMVVHPLSMEKFNHLLAENPLDPP